MSRKATGTNAVNSYCLSDSDDDFMINGGAPSDDSDFDFDDDIDAAPTKAKAKAPTVTNKTKAVKATTKKRLSSTNKSTTNKKANAVSDSSSRPVLAEKSTNSDASDEAMVVNDPIKKSGNSSKKTVEERYQKLTQLEHILVRPDTYIGSVERSTQEMYVLQGEQIIEKEITYTPGLYKIFDEILVNAADNKQRDPNMDKLEIDISSENNTISVKNNGKGIPIEFHKNEKCYVPTLVFGHLLTGSNFDDNEKKTTGGRNGYGAKLANIFSTKFIVECADTNTGKKFKQVFRSNMKISDEPIIKDLSAAEKKKGDFVKITFSPDLEKFKMTSLDDDIVSLFSKRAYDIAGSMARCPGKTLAVMLNGNKVPVKKFADYLKMYNGIEPPIAYEDDGNRWEIGVGISDGSFKQVSFVNSICTSKGGEHVNTIASMVAKRVSQKIQKKKNHKNMKISENQIKNHLAIFVNCLIENPSFDSQTKETLTTKKARFGSKCELSEKFLAKIEKSDIIEKVLSYAMFREKQTLGKQSGKKKIKLTGITKLDDANFAGSAKSTDCTLILTEGDSAKSLAMSGISVVGRDYYGVFPLKGKPLNVRDAALSLVTKNEEIKNIIDIMGLKFNVTYDESNIKTLRYGHLMIMADQDHDGSHIKGLIINFLHTFWPSLLDVPGFLQQFITPIVKATKGKQAKTFFTLPEYESWKASTGNDAKGWKIKYYKGLGTSTSAEAKEYFSHLDSHEINFCELSADECRIIPLTYSSSDSDNENPDVSVEIMPEQVKSGADMIELAFSKKMAEERKQWLSNLEKDTFLDYSLAKHEGVKYSDFINKELILFSQADTHRSIPNLFDGFKPSQRKVLFGCFLKNLKNEMKVAQLCGYIGEKSAYHHGEASLQATIVGMAQDFTGSNNINLLTPSGQFGTRRMGGKDSASPRYIFTKLEKITRAIFHPDDDPLLTYLHEDGESIEPEFYVPIIPMVLVNGADGIGTGWSTSIPTYNPRDIIANIYRKLDGDDFEKMHPYFYGFGGTVEANSSSDGGYIVSGKIDRVDDTTLHISELPIRSWTQDYKMFLEKMVTGDEKKKIEPELKDFTENHTDTTVSFTITATKENIDKFEKEKDGLYGKFKLRTKISTSNMNVFDKYGRIAKFANPEALLDMFYRERLHYYELRKNHLLDQMRREQRMLQNKARFVEEVCSGNLVVSNRKRTQLLADLKDRKYELFPKQNNNSPNDQESENEEDDNNSDSDSDLAKGYEYLLGMKIWSLTYEKAQKLRNELSNKTKAVEDLEATSIKQIWRNDLTILEAELDERDQSYADAAVEELKAQGKNKKHQAKKKKQSRKKKLSSESDDDDSDDDYSETTKKASSRSTVKKTTVKKSTAKKAAELVIAKSPKVAKKVAKKVVDLDANPFEFKFSGSSEESDMKTNFKSVSLEIASDSEPEESLSLFERMQKKTGMTKSMTKLTMTEKMRGTKRSSPKTSTKDDLDALDDFDSFDTSSYEPASLTPAPKRKRTSNKKVPTKTIEIDSDDEMLEVINETSKKATNAKKTTRKPSTKDAVASDCENNDDKLDDESSEEEEIVMSKPRSRSTRQRKTIKYNIDSDEDDSDDDFYFDD